MKHIKDINLFNEYKKQVTNEKMNWREFALGAAIIAGIYYYKGEVTIGKDTKMEASRLDNIVTKVIDDTKNTPSVIQGRVLDSIRLDLVNDIKNTNGIDSSRKKRVIDEITNLVFVVASREDILSITSNEATVAFYFKYIHDKNVRKTIVINRSYLADDVKSRRVIFHELRHLVDDMLVDDTKDEFMIGFSEKNNITEILDKDIIIQNEEGKAKLENRINAYTDLWLKNRYAKSGKDFETSSEEKKMKSRELVSKTLRVLITKNMEYKSSPSEVYVRFHGMKKWMLENKIISDINDEITEEHIKETILNAELIDRTIDAEADFLDLLFYLKVDVVNDQKDAETMKKINSIVMNFKDYNNDIA